VRFPAVPECWLLAGRALARGGEVARAAPLLERFLELAPLDAEAPSAWHMLVGAAIARGDEARAAELRARAQASAQWQAFYKTRRIQAREKPGEPLPKLGIAELFLAVGEFERARAAARTLTEQHPDFGRGWVALGRAEAGSGSLEAAQKACERAIACDGTLAPAHLELARILARRGDKEKAEDRYARYRALGGTEPLERR
jgi:predicted Zn-dependent protease